MSRIANMLAALHAVGVEVQPNAEWSREEWQNYVIHQFNLSCMPPHWQSAAEAAQVVYLLRRSRNQVWNTPFKPGRYHG